MPERKVGRPRAAESEPRACIRWLNGRAYAELGAWAEWGGRRQEPLVARGEKAATQDPNTATILLAHRLSELREKRDGGARRRSPSGVPTSIVAFIGFHLAAKADVKGRRRPSAWAARTSLLQLFSKRRTFLRHCRLRGSSS